jgi:hypothetical protein
VGTDQEPRRRKVAQPIVSVKRPRLSPSLPPRSGGEGGVHRRWVKLFRAPDAARAAPPLRRGALQSRGLWCRYLAWVPALRSSVKNAAPHPGHEFLTWRRRPFFLGSDLPDGLFLTRSVQILLQKYFAFQVG